MEITKAISKTRALNIYGHLCRQNNYKETLYIITGSIRMITMGYPTSQVIFIHHLQGMLHHAKFGKIKVKVKLFSRVQLFATPLSRQEYWSGLPFPSPEYLPDQGLNLHLQQVSCIAGGFCTIEPTGKPQMRAQMREQVLNVDSKNHNSTHSSLNFSVFCSFFFFMCYQQHCFTLIK